MDETRSWMSRLPSLDALRVFQAAAHHRSFSRAARELHVTQGAVSHRIRGLEEALGQPLFERGHRRVEPTEAGRLLLRAVDEAMDTLEAGLAALGRPGQEGLVVVSCSPSFAIRWLVPHLPALRAALPHLDVRIAAEDRLVQPGHEGIDACIRYGPPGEPGPGAAVDEVQLSVEQVTPVLSPRLLAQGPPLSSPDDLRHCTLLHDEVLRDHPGRVGWERWLRAAGATQVDPRRGPRFSHAHLALEAALAGQGVALARGILVARDLAEGRLVAPFALRLESGLTYRVLTPRRGLRPAVRQFVDWLVAAVRDG